MAGDTSQNGKEKKAGRPSLLNPELIEKAKTYLEWCEKNPVLTGKTKTVTKKLARRESGESEEEEDSDETAAVEGVEKSVEQESHPRLPTIAGLARHLGVSRDSIYEWVEQSDEFSDVYEAVRQANEDVAWIHGGAGTLNPSIARLALAQHGHVERKEISGPDGGPIKFQSVKGFNLVPDAEIAESDEE